MNVETKCAHYGSLIVDQATDRKKVETVTRNALGVLREDGLFAFYLYLQYRSKEGGGLVWKQVKALWQDSAVGPLMSGDGNDQQTDREQVIALTGDLNDLLLAREVAERALVYALYGLRAGG